MICLFNKYKKSVQKRTDFFDNSFFNAVPDKPLATRNKPHNNQLCADLSRFISAYPVGSHFLRFAWQTTVDLPVLMPCTCTYAVPPSAFQAVSASCGNRYSQACMTAPRIPHRPTAILQAYPCRHSLPQ